MSLTNHEAICPPTSFDILSLSKDQDEGLRQQPECFLPSPPVGEGGLAKKASSGEGGE